MRAIDRTTKLFVASVKEAVPDARIVVEKSRALHGWSNYVYIDLKDRGRVLKVRISDHPVGMRRALYGDEHLFIHHRAKPASWAVWISHLPRGNTSELQRSPGAPLKDETSAATLWS